MKCFASWPILQSLRGLMLIVCGLLILPLLVSCLPLENDGWPNWNEVTPNGYRVDFSGCQSVDRDVVLGWIDSRVESWQLARCDGYGGVVYGIPYACVFKTVDYWAFPTIASPTGWAVGMVNTGADHPLIWCSIFQGHKCDSPPDPATLEYPYTLGPYNGQWAYGTLYDDGMGLLVIGHELDHLLGIDHE